MEKIKSIEWPEYFRQAFEYPPTATIFGRSRINLEAAEQYGRLVFDKADSIKRSRGKHFPYALQEGDDTGSFMYEVLHSKWLEDRYSYEKKHYEKSYEFGGRVDEMISEYHHYFLPLEDDFIEVLARGFWCKRSEQPLPWVLTDDHPLASLQKKGILKVIKYGAMQGHVYLNPLPDADLQARSRYCPHKKLQFGLVVNDHVSIARTLLVIRNNTHEIFYSWRGQFGEELKKFAKPVGLEEIKDLLTDYMQEVEQRRQERNLSLE